MSRSHDARIEDAATAWTVRRDAGLTPAEEREFAGWLKTDPRHAEAFRRHGQVWAALDRPRKGGKSEVLLQKFAAHEARKKRRVRTAATALVVLLGIGTLWQWRTPALPVSAPPSALVLAPEKRTLADGSIVELKAGAEIAVDFSGPLRRVALAKGEALFHVAKKKDRPFVVTVAGVEVRAVGTAFSVQLGQREVAVLVTEGRVAVKQVAAADPTASAGSEPSFVDAGSRLVVNLESKAPVLTAAAPAEVAERLAWRAPRLEFSDTLLSEAVELMNRHNQVKFVLDDTALAEVRVTGLFRADNVDAFVRLLEASFGIKAERSGDTIILRKVR